MHICIYTYISIYVAGHTAQLVYYARAQSAPSALAHGLLALVRNELYEPLLHLFEAYRYS